jgi:hypothetical protein
MALKPTQVQLTIVYSWMILVTLLVGAVGLLLLPSSLIAPIKPLKKFQDKLRTLWNRAVELSFEGPAFKLMVWSGKKGCCGRLSSKCRPPKSVKAKPQSTKEAFLHWTPDLPRNPFHEEEYICSWRIADEKKETWRSKQMGIGEFEESNGRMKACVDALPPNTKILFRVCAANSKGRGPWSEEAMTRTLAEPTKEGGYFGPLGPAADRFPEDRRQYRWTQMRGDIGVIVPILEDWKSSDIRFTKLPTRFELVYVGPTGDLNEVILAGKFPQRAKPDEMFWEIDTDKQNGRHIMVTMTKADPLKQWGCVFEGEEHPCIDTGYVRLLTDGMDDNIDWLKNNNPH